MALDFLLGFLTCLALYGLARAVKRHIFAIHTVFETGERRRRLAPPHVDVVDRYWHTPGYAQTILRSPAAANIRNERGFVALRNGQAIFYQTWLPPEGAAAVDAAVIFLHGYAHHSDTQSGAVPARVLAVLSQGRVGAVSFDMPGWGRSDGLFDDVPDYFAFVSASREVIAEHLLPLVQRWRHGIKVFGFGSSLGGGVLFSILAQEKALLDGAVLVCPMLYVDKNLIPPKLILLVFKHVLVKFFPTWPLTPIKDLSDLVHKDPEVMKANLARPKEAIPPIKGMKPRLATSYNMAFVGGEWMASMIPEYDTPTLIIHSADDKMTDPRVSKALFEGMSCADKEFLHPKGLAHADLLMGGPTLVDDNRERFEHILDWIRERC
eukprot:NODE_8452_length_1495_cov_2.911550.p1 GENE.NODE_8452_length_1495_cov_2.911550~~NODE_8452_length_1495_cov_2.911550.p1  ORF type:complete len:379 (+),score=72.54 NODE_8452_length_1495_cov_2.911550:117-1253(+)